MGQKPVKESSDGEEPSEVKPPEPDSPSSGSRLPLDLLASLLSYLSLIDCIRLESVSQSFVDAIYQGQSCFVWSATHRRTLKERFAIDSSGDSFEADYLKLVSQKIGPKCRLLRLKLQRMPPNAKELLKRFTSLESLWLQFDFDSPEQLAELFADPNIFPRGSMRELRIMLLGPKDAQSTCWLPASFKWLLASLTALQSLSIWRAEAQFSRAILAMKDLQSLSLFCNDETLSFFENFCKHNSGNGNSTLKHLSVSWHVDQLERKGNFTQFMVALGRLKIESLHLQVTWCSVKAVRGEEEQSLLNQWMAYMRPRLAKILRRLSLAVQCLQPGTVIDTAHMIHAFTFGMERLRFLRLQLMDAATFPLQISSMSVKALELDFRYLKKVTEKDWETVAERSKYVPRFRNVNVYLFRKIRHETSIRSLRLLYCPLPLDGDLSRHLVRWFPSLETFHFTAFHPSVYPSKLDHILQKHLLGDLEHVRVIQLADTFKRPDLKGSIEVLIGRAQKNHHKAYRFVCDVSKFAPMDNYDDVCTLLAMIRNIRIH